MTLRHLRIFIEVCRQNYNITRAAENLYMSQPAVSLSIRELEDYYGVKLFERISRKLYITEVGKQMEEYATHLLSMFDDMERGLRNWDSVGILRVGASMTIGSQFMPEYVRIYQKLYPGMEIRVRVATSDHLEQELLDNQLDIALIEGIVHSQHLVCEEYMEDSLVAVCAANGVFGQGEKVSLERFRCQKFLLREKGSGTREEFDSAARLAGFSVEPLWESTSTSALVNAVICGLGIAVLPQRRILEPLEKGLIVQFEVDGIDLRRKFMIVYHKNKYLSASAQNFINFCKNYELNYPLPNFRRFC